MELPVVTLSTATINDIDLDIAAHRPTASPLVAAGLPFSIGGLFNAILPYLIKALEALAEVGIAQPTPAQVVAKCNELHELAGCR
jgi:hypothetical protein